MRKRRNTHSVLVRLDADKDTLLIAHLEKLSELGKMNDWIRNVLLESFQEDIEEIRTRFETFKGLDEALPNTIVKPKPRPANTLSKLLKRTAWPADDYDPVSDPIYALVEDNP